MDDVIPIIFIAVGVTIDLFSVWLALRYNRKRVGSSGLPVIPLVFYMIPSVMHRPLLTDSYHLDFGIWIVFHIFLRYFIPYVDRKYFPVDIKNKLQ